MRSALLQKNDHFRKSERQAGSTYMTKIMLHCDAAIKNADVLFVIDKKLVMSSKNVCNFAT